MHESTPIHSDTASYLSSSYSASHSGSGVYQSGSRPNGYSASRVYTANVVAGNHSGSRSQQAPNNVQPALSNYGAAVIQNAPGKYGTGDDGSTNSHFSSGSRTPHTGTTHREPSSIHSTITSKPYSSDQSRSHPNRHSAYQVHFNNVVPSTQTATNGVQPNLSSYGAAGVQNVPSHYGNSEGGSTTQHVSSHYIAPRTRNGQQYPSSIYSTSTSKPYKTDLNKGHPNWYSASQIHSTNVVQSTQSTSNSVQPTLSSSGTVSIQTAPGHHGTSKGSSTTKHVFSRYTAPNAGTTRYELGSIHSTSSPYGAAQIENPLYGYSTSQGHVNNVVSNTQEGSRTGHVLRIGYGVGSTFVPGHNSDNSVIQHESTQHTSSNEQSVPAQNGLTQSTSALSSQERPQDSRYYSSGMKAVSSLSGGISVSSKVNCTSKSSKAGPSKFIQVQRDSRHGYRTYAQRAIKRGNGATPTS